MADSNTVPTETRLSIPDRNVQGVKEPAREEEQGTGARKWRTRKEIVDVLLQKEMESFSTWDQIFIVSCSIAVLLDPLFPYTSVLDHDRKCVWFDKTLDMVYVALRTTIDLFYAVDALLYMRRITHHNNNIAKTFGRKLLLLLRSPAVQHRTLLAFPFPQLAVINYPVDPLTFSLFLIFSFQYALRVAANHRLLNHRSNTETGIGRLLKALLDFLPFILAAHLFGALWYYLTFYKELRCWISACKHDKRCDLSNYLKFSSLCIGKSENMTVLNILDKLCPKNPTYATIFDPSMTESRDLPRKMLHGFWWGLRNLSSFGSNLQTSFNAMEITFSIFVSVSGIMLFLIYLNERLQVSKKKSKDDKLRLKMQMLNLEIDLWISQNGLSQTPRYLSKQLKNAIKKNARQKFEQNEDIDLQNIFSLLPKIHKEHIMRLLGLASLRKVPVFQNIDEEVLGEICERLKPLTYTADDCIIQEGEPLEKILFITRGTVWSYTTGSNIANGGSTSKVSTIVTCLQQGDLCGKELLEWASIGGAPLSEFPISTVVVKAKTKVEGFAIRANDLKTFFSRSWRHFPNMELRRIWATCFIQTMWRMHQARVAAS